ncbi:hypothetical protein [Ralstonia pseudosolanacearum]|uniref:hypothetical protein n=1 Tax=Ralstonia pseudosolanacearum TaxID=1310165 RepID=UPI003CEF9C34
MGTFQKLSTLSLAEVILAIAQTMIGDDDPDFYVGAFKSAKATGLQITTEDGERRSNVLGNTNSDGYVVNVGGRKDYNYESGHALDTATRFDFGHDEPYQAARCLVDWLKNGTLPTDRQASSF